MTKSLPIICLLALASCSTSRGPASIGGHPAAYDSMALGNVRSHAVKRVSAAEVCFDVQITGKDIKPEQAQSSNWTLAWVDQHNVYHLLPASQRNPASVGGVVVAPYGAYNEFTSEFTTCAPRTDSGTVRALVLTPKDLPYEKKDGMKLTWDK